MQYSSSDSDSDCIDTTGCEKMFEPTYWDINYFRSIEIDNEADNDDEEDEDKIQPKVKEIQRYRHIEEMLNGEQRDIEYVIPEEDSDEELSQEDSEVSYEKDISINL